MNNFEASKKEEINIALLEKRSDAVISNQMRLKMSFSCSFCLGFGHTVKECSTMKKLNKVTEKGSFA